MNTFDTNPQTPRTNRTLIGTIFIAAGALLLVKHLGLFFFPFWFFSWPMILIGFGVISGIKHNFRNPGSFIMIALGIFFLLGRIIGFAFTHFFWPLILMAIGVRLLFGHERYFHGNWNRRSGYGPRVDIPVE